MSVRTCTLAAVVLMTATIVPVSAASATKPTSQQAKLLFVVNGSGGTFEPRQDAPSTYTLTLTGVDNDVTWFTDRPERSAGVVALEHAISAIGFGNEGAGPPNAVISTRGGDAASDTLAVQLGDPVYDSTAGTVSFNATPLKQPRKKLAPGLGFAGDRLDRTMSPTFGPVSLFIDDTDTEVQADGQLAPTEPVPSGAPVAGATPDTVPDGSGENGRAITFGLQVEPGPGVKRVSVRPVIDGYNDCVDLAASTSGEFDVGTTLVSMVTGGEDLRCSIDVSQMHWIVKYVGPVSGIAEVRVSGRGSSYSVNCAPIGATTSPKLDCAWGWHSISNPVVVNVVGS